MTRLDADAVVVGAGPAGSAAAYFLAADGYRVLLLDKRKFPRDKACGDGVTGPGLQVIGEMGALGALADAQSYDGLRVHIRGRARDFQLGGPNDDRERRPDQGLVVPRLRLDELLCRTASERGAEIGEEWDASELLVEDGRVQGVRAAYRGRSRTLRARFVVCADGATSGLARKSGLIPHSREAMGYAVRGYYTGIAESPPRLEFFLPITDPADGYLLPSYGWVFPTGRGAANIGVGLSFRANQANVRRVFERFMAWLGETDERFRAARLDGKWRGAPVRSDFAPERCQAPGVTLVGDAAGMVSPFTGEGISYALESGKLAAESIRRALSDDPARLSDGGRYVATLRRRYGGYFETGRETIERYELVFRVLESTYNDDRPLFALCRRAAFMPEGVGGLRSSDILDDVGDLVEPIVTRLRTDLAAVDEANVRAVQPDWPFLSRLGASVDRDLVVPARPATLLLACAYLGRPKGVDLIDLAAAVELSYLAAVSHAGLDLSDPPDSREKHWGNLFALLTGNFQLAKALELSTRVGPRALDRIVASVSDLCEGRVQELRLACDPSISADDYVRIVVATNGRSLEAICDLGGLVADVDEDTRTALRKYGRHLGVAQRLAEEVVSVAGGSAVGVSAADELLAGRMTLPVALALRNEALAPPLRALLARASRTRDEVDDALARVAASGVAAATVRVVRAQAEAAADVAERLPPSGAADALRAVTEYPVRRATAHLPPAAAVHSAAQRGVGDDDGGSAWSLPERLGVADDIERLVALLGRWREQGDPEVSELVDYQLGGPAKYFRPSTVFACYRAVSDDVPPGRILRGAAAVELFHNSTLIVDDIVDRDATRRGKPALHRRFGRARGLATGFYLTFGAGRLIAEDHDTCRALHELGKRIVVAECRQWRLRRRAQGVEVWRGLAGEDTGVMFEIAARVALPDGTLDRFGYLLGTLYHGCDDVADVRGAAALGGGREKDIVDRILTLPASLAVADPATAQMFEEGGADIDEKLAARYAAVLPEAEAVLDEIAQEAVSEAILRAPRPQRLLDLVRYTRALASA